MLLDGKITAGEEENAWAHLRSCQACYARFQYARELREGLRSMSRTPAPGGLIAQLRALAFRDRELRLRRVSFSLLFRRWAVRMRLRFDDLMRPVALPVAGGLISALLLVGMWVPVMAAKQSVNDVPLPAWLCAGPSGKDVRSVSAANDVVVVLTIDERGRVADYIVTSGEMTPDLGDMILRSRFNPATVFGRPTSGTLVYRHISVIG